MATFAMATVDPDSGQLVEVPMDPNNTYVVQDQSGQVHLSGGGSAGKSLLKPELAQHLIQPMGYKTSLSRGGYTQSIVDPRMTQTVQRGSKVFTRKPFGSSGMQLVGINNGGLIQQSSMTPSASGLLSLGSRYTPSSGTTFGIGSVSSNNPSAILAAGANIVSSGGLVTGFQGGSIFTSGSMINERDPGYRLAAAMTGASSRGRPRGRRPLRGQFPVVPIDMVRQLGIEQQVILQPAAPVAMRNKAILCRPLSVSRKTQVLSHKIDAECQTERVNFIDALREEKQLCSPEKREEEEDDEEEDILVDADIISPLKDSNAANDNLDEIDSDSSMSEISTKDTERTIFLPDSPKLRANFEASANTTQTDNISTTLTGTQTDSVVKEKAEKTIEFLPIPIPVPIYIPVPVYLYARPIPYAIPFPLPCIIPLPMLLKGNELDEKVVTKPEKETSLTETKFSQENSSKTTRPCELQRPNLKRHDPPRDSLQSVRVSPNDNQSYQPTLQMQPSSSISTTQSPTHQPSKRQRTNTHESHRIPLAIIDTNYHLKFSYGINAWRHWVNNCLSTTERQAYQYNLRTELLDVPTKDLNMALSHFVHQVRKPNNETYVADSIFYLCLGIQEYLNENGRSVNIFGNPEFSSFEMSLDSVLADFQPRISPEGLLICRIEEEHLWEARQLGSESPNILLFTMVYFITKHFCIRTGESHGQLNFANFRLKCEENGEFIQFISNLSDAKGTDNNFPNQSINPICANAELPNRCPVNLYNLYLKKCPSSVVSQCGPLYLTPLFNEDMSSETLFSDAPMNIASLQVMLNRIKMVKEIQEAFMHSQSD